MKNSSRGDASVWVPLIMLLLLFAIAAGAYLLRSSNRAQLGALGVDQHVILYSVDGHVIREWYSDGKVATEGNSDGWYFRDRATGRLVRVSGTVMIESQ